MNTVEALMVEVGHEANEAAGRLLHSVEISGSIGRHVRSFRRGWSFRQVIRSLGDGCSRQGRIRRASSSPYLCGSPVRNLR